MTPSPTAGLVRQVKCLIVDDVEENLVALEALLQRDDLEVLKARSGPEALEILLAVQDIALALLDVQMPEMDGFELAELMRGSARTRAIPIIFVTAGARDQQRVFKGYETGAVDFLYKPLDPRLLRSKVEVFLQLHRQKQQLSLQLEELTETLRLNEMFMAVLGHDLRDPLSAIMTGATLLEDLQGEELKEFARDIHTSGARMLQMIEDLLDLARARLGGGISLRCERLDLGAIARRIVHEQQASSPHVRLELQTEGNLHGCWDGARLSQVFSNLIGNAVKHGLAGAPVVVRVDGMEASEVVIKVTNAGRIAPEVLPHLFDPFRAGREGRGGAEGLGLGLYIVQQIAQAHGGDVSVLSCEERGTVFTVQLPRVTNETAPRTGGLITSLRNRR